MSSTRLNTNLKDCELHQLDADMAYLEAGVIEELYIKLPEDYHDCCDQVGPRRIVMVESVQR